MAGSEEPTRPFFYGLQPRWLSWDRFYRVYVSKQMIVGAYVAGQLYDERSAALQLQGARLFLRPLVRRWLARRQELETLYDTLDPFGPLLLDRDPRNFQIARTEIAHTRFRRNRSYWTGYNVGVVECERFDGTVLRLILAGDQDPDTILRLMQQFDAMLAVTGEPNPLPRPKPMTAASTRRMYLILACSLLGFGFLFTVVALAGIVAAPAYLPLAVVNLLSGIWALVKAWRVPND